MKNSILVAAFVVFSFNWSKAQESRTNYDANVQSVDTIVKSIYAIISGAKGEPRDWELMRHIFHPEANMVVNYSSEDGEPQIGFLSPADYIQNFSESMEARDLLEREVHREIQRFGNMVHVFSTFMTYEREDDPKPFKQGISSIQLFDDGERWWVINMYWKNEDPNTSIPAEYMPDAQRH